MKKVAVVLSGCGVFDGSEITESTALLIALSQAGFTWQCFAPDRQQAHVVNHLNGEVEAVKRNILQESARIARSNVLPLSTLAAEDYEALLLPGGFGAAKNLCNFAFAGEQAALEDDIKAAGLAFIRQQKPLLALCAAPVVLALLAKEAGIKEARLTVGSEEEGKSLADAIRAWGQVHEAKPIDEACIDACNRFVTAPAYMYGAATPAGIYASCQAAVAGLQTLL